MVSDGLVTENDSGCLTGPLPSVPIPWTSSLGYLQWQLSRVSPSCNLWPFIRMFEMPLVCP